MLILFSGNIASCSTRNESANEPLDENTRAHREESETSNDGSDRYKDERGISYINIFIKLVVRYRIMHFDR